MLEAEKTKEVDCYPYVASEDPVTTLPEKAMGEEPNRRRQWSRKQMVQVIGVFILLLLAITVAFILILLFVPTRQIPINNTTHRVVGERTVDETEFIDGDEILMQYQLLVSKNGEETYVILDLNRNLEIMRITMDSGLMDCFVSPILALDPTFTTPYNETTNATKDIDIKNNATNASAVVNFKRSSYPIRDISILGPKGVALCKKSKVYWSIPQCGWGTNGNQPEVPSDDNRGRKKRATWNQWCRWDWSYCYYFSFPNDSRSYYRCAILCSWVWY